MARYTDNHVMCLRCWKSISCVVEWSVGFWPLNNFNILHLQCRIAIFFVCVLFFFGLFFV